MKKGKTTSYFIEETN